MKTIFWGLLFSMACAVVYGGEPIEKIEGGAERMNFFMSYYKNPQPDKIIEKIKVGHSKGVLDIPEHGGSYLGFLAGFMINNPAQVESLLTLSETFPDTAREIVLGAAWYSQSEQARIYFKTKKLKQFMQIPPKILDVNIENPTTLDIYWGYYFATGDKTALFRVISFLKYADHYDQKNLSKQYQIRKGLSQVASWSIESNCKNDDRILELCIQILAEEELNPIVLTSLGMILENISPDRVKVRYDSKKQTGEVIIVPSNKLTNK